MTCPHCRLPVALCICALIPAPRLETVTTRLVLIVNDRERRKPSNTGVLATRCLARSEVEVVGKQGQTQRKQHIVANDEVPLLLFPSEGAPSIEQFAGQRVVLFVPDGSWPQAKRMKPHGPGCERVQRVTLPDLGPSEYRLREEPQPGGLATLEAIGRALRILEGTGGAAVEEVLLGVFRTMVERTLRFRGKLNAIA